MMNLNSINLHPIICSIIIIDQSKPQTPAAPLSMDKLWFTAEESNNNCNTIIIIIKKLNCKAKDALKFLEYFYSSPPATHSNIH